MGSGGFGVGFASLFCREPVACLPQLQSWSEDNKLQSNHQMGCFKRMAVRGQNVEAKLRRAQP